MEWGERSESGEWWWNGVKGVNGVKVVKCGGMGWEKGVNGVKRVNRAVRWISMDVGSEPYLSQQ